MALPNGDIKLFFKNARLNTFTGWRLDREDDAICTSDRLADAGFFSTATVSEPDSAKCAFCHKELLWDKEDDPWTEHRKRGNCAYVKLAKPENEWTLQDVMELLLARDARIKVNQSREALEDYYHNTKRVVDNVKKLVGEKN